MLLPSDAVLYVASHVQEVAHTAWLESRSPELGLALITTPLRCQPNLRDHERSRR